ncbi:hypothetical protein ACFL46_01940 [Candidatus Neomarinimicrobiota bacterium]
MKLGRWLNSLNFNDFLVLIIIFAIASFLTHRTLIFARNWYQKRQKDNPYAAEFRITTFSFFIVTVPYILILYKIFSTTLRSWLDKIF